MAACGEGFCCAADGMTHHVEDLDLHVGSLGGHDAQGLALHGDAKGAVSDSTDGSIVIVVLIVVVVFVFVLAVARAFVAGNNLVNTFEVIHIHS